MVVKILCFILLKMHLMKTVFKMIEKFDVESFRGATLKL